MPVFTFYVTGTLNEYIKVEAPDSYAAEMRFNEELMDGIQHKVDIQVESIKDEDGNEVESVY